MLAINPAGVGFARPGFGNRSSAPRVNQKWPYDMNAVTPFKNRGPVFNGPHMNIYLKLQLRLQLLPWNRPQAHHVQELQQAFVLVEA